MILEMISLKENMNGLHKVVGVDLILLYFTFKVLMIAYYFSKISFIFSFLEISLNSKR